MNSKANTCLRLSAFISGFFSLSLCLCGDSSISPENVIFDSELALRGSNVFSEAVRILWIAGGRTEVRDMGAPESVECLHRQFAEVFGRHRRKCRGQEALALHAECDAGSRFCGAPSVAAFDVTFVEGFDPVFGEMMLQQCGVKVAAPVFVAQGVDWGLGAGGWGLVGVILFDFVEHLAEETYGYV